MKFISHPRLALVSVLLLSLLAAPRALGLTIMTASPPAGPAAQATTVYIVQPGDTLSSIARRFGTTVAAIVEANGIANPDFIWVGQRLIIPLPGTPPPECEVIHIVQRGETLSGIARQYGTTVAAIVAANGLTNPDLIWVGQQLIIPVCGTPTPPMPPPTPSPTLPGPTPTPAPPTPSPTPTCEVIYIVQPGDTLSAIARQFGTTVAAIVEANGIVNPDLIFVGQRLIIPVCGTPLPPTPSPGGEKWIDINLSTQTLIAYEGSTPVLQTLISSGVPAHPSPVGTFYVYLKLISQDMSGPGYYLPDVPYVMYFYNGYAIHGTYWHSSFGQPMSHGCINLPIPEAGWLYEWTPMGTPVVLHY